MFLYFDLQHWLTTLTDKFDLQLWLMTLTYDFDLRLWLMTLNYDLRLVSCDTYNFDLHLQLWLSTCDFQLRLWLAICGYRRFTTNLRLTTYDLRRLQLITFRNYNYYAIMHPHLMLSKKNKLLTKTPRSEPIIVCKIKRHSWISTIFDLTRFIILSYFPLI